MRKNPVPLIKAPSASPAKPEPKDCGATAGGGAVVYGPALDTSKSAPVSKIGARN